MKNDSQWFDERGLMHHIPNPTTDASENELLYTAEYVLLAGGPAIKLYHMNKFYIEEWESGKHMSHDNRTGFLSVANMYGATDTYSIFKLGNRWWFHPRDIVYYGYMKHGFWFWPLLPIVSISNIISCARTWKTHDDGRKEITTSGKLLAYVRNKSAGLTLTHKICTWLIRRNPVFKSWTLIAKMYFPYTGKEGSNHPIVTLMAYEEMQP